MCCGMVYIAHQAKTSDMTDEHELVPKRFHHACTSPLLRHVSTAWEASAMYD